jgi:hypothetical protein
LLSAIVRLSFGGGVLSTITSNGPICLLVKVRRLLCLSRI